PRWLPAPWVLHTSVLHARGRRSDEPYSADRDSRRSKWYAVSWRSPLHGISGQNLNANETHSGEFTRPAGRPPLASCHLLAGTPRRAAPRASHPPRHLL